MSQNGQNFLSGAFIAASGFLILQSEAYDVYLTVGHVATCLLALVMLRTIASGRLCENERVYWFLAGATAANLIAATRRANASVGVHSPARLWLPLVDLPFFVRFADEIAGVLLFALIAATVTALLGAPASAPAPSTTPPGWSVKQRAQAAVGMFFAPSVFRYFHNRAVMSGTPNEERSLFLFGLEVHHFASGAVVCFALIELARRPAATRSFMSSVRGMISAVFGAASVLDQATFMALRRVSDEAYDRRVSMLGAYVGVALAVFAIASAPRARLMSKAATTATTTTKKES